MASATACRYMYPLRWEIRTANWYEQLVGYEATVVVPVFISFGNNGTY